MRYGVLIDVTRGFCFWLPGSGGNSGRIPQMGIGCIAASLEVHLPEAVDHSEASFCFTQITLSSSLPLAGLVLLNILEAILADLDRVSQGAWAWVFQGLEVVFGL